MKPPTQDPLKNPVSSRAIPGRGATSTKPAVSSGFLEADERARTVDLLHGKDVARAD